jgi:hypothetical protein
MYRFAIAVALGIAITVALCIVLLAAWNDYPLNIVAKILLWPITAFMQLAGAGPRIGPPEKNMHEATPVHVLAFLLGFSFSCIFYSVLSFVVLRWRANRSTAT